MCEIEYEKFSFSSRELKNASRWSLHHLSRYQSHYFLVISHPCHNAASRLPLSLPICFYRSCLLHCPPLCPLASLTATCLVLNSQLFVTLIASSHLFASLPATSYSCCQQLDSLNLLPARVGQLSAPCNLILCGVHCPWGNLWNWMHALSRLGS